MNETMTNVEDSDEMIELMMKALREDVVLVPQDLARAGFRMIAGERIQ